MKILFYTCFVLSLVSCDRYLDMKPDIHMDIPNTLEDCELLLNDYNSLNTVYPAATITAGEEFYLNTDTWFSLSSLDDQNDYIWSDEAVIVASNWQGPYKAIFLANQIISVLEGINRDDQNKLKYDQVLGNALFFRAFAYHQLLQLYTLPYDPATAKTTFGLPLKFTPDLLPTLGRASLEDTYQSVLNDYIRASQLLSVMTIAKSRPNRVAALAGLARTYLDMQNYENAYRYADSAWRLQPTLMNFNTLDIYEELPIPKNNQEVIFSALSGYSDAIGRYGARINPDLIELYADGDIRRELFYMENEDEPGTYGYKANYDQSESGAFIGLTTSEVLLIRAEAASRIGEVSTAISDLELLWQHRFENGISEPIDHMDAQQVLRTVLEERRRELVYRGRRWADLRRLNQDPAYQVTLKRTVNDITYSLLPESPRYAFLIPQVVIELNLTIEQNER